MDAATLLDDATAARIEAGATERKLAIGKLAPGQIGVITASVNSVGTVRTFTRKDGKEGMLRRVTIGDPTGEVDVVLWGEETQKAVDGPLVAGKQIVLRGATVKDGFRGGIEVHLGGAVIEENADPLETCIVDGTLESIGATKIIGDPPNNRFQAEITLATADGQATAVLWDDDIKTVRSVLPGARILIEGATPHPAVEGRVLTEGAAIRTG